MIDRPQLDRGCNVCGVCALFFGGREKRRAVHWGS